MILYLDTSALVKLYDLEEGRDLVEQAVDEAAVLTTSSVAYAEARVSLARKRREEVFSEEELREAVAALDGIGKPSKRSLSRRMLPGWRETWRRGIIYEVSTPSIWRRRF